MENNKFRQEITRISIYEENKRMSTINHRIPVPEVRWILLEVRLEV